MPQLDVNTSGVMIVTLQGAEFGQLLLDPRGNPDVKTFELEATALRFEVFDERNNSGWAHIAVNIPPDSHATMTVTSDTNAIGWYGNADINYNPQDIGLPNIKDTISSGVGGTNSAVIKTYNIGH